MDDKMKNQMEAIKNANAELKQLIKDLQIKADADNTALMIDKLNEEFEDMYNENEENKTKCIKFEKDIDKLKEEKYFYDQDIRCGKIKVSIHGLHWLEVFEEMEENCNNKVKWDKEKFGSKDNAKTCWNKRMSGCIESILEKQLENNEGVWEDIMNEMNNGDEYEISYSDNEDYEYGEEIDRTDED